MLAVARELGQITIGDKNDYGRKFEARIDTVGIDLLRPARKGEKPMVGNASSSCSPGDRVRQRDVQRPARPRSPRREDRRRSLRPHCPARPPTHSPDLAQRPTRRHRQMISDRLRPLTTPWNHSSRHPVTPEGSESTSPDWLGLVGLEHGWRVSRCCEDRSRCRSR